MSAQNGSEISAAAMFALRDRPEALKTITDQLQVQAMGPADWIKTKHEVKAWLETAGSLKEAEAIIVRARARRDLQQTQGIAQDMAQRQQRGRGIEQN